MVEETNWLKVAGYAMSLGVGLYLVPIGMVAQADIIHLLDKPFDATLAFIQLALSLAAISYGLISAVSLLAVKPRKSIRKILQRGSRLIE